MRKAPILASLAVLLAVATPVTAQADATATPATATTTLYLHTPNQANADHLARIGVGGAGPSMDATPPARPAPSVAVAAVGNATPERGVYEAVWEAPLNGTLTGSADLVFWATSVSATSLTVRLMADGATSPTAAVDVDTPPSAGPAKYTAHFDNLDIAVADHLTVGVWTNTLVTTRGGDNEVYFDAASTPSAFTFTLAPPPSGTTSGAFAVYPAPSRFVDAHGPNETSIGLSANGTDAMFLMNRSTAHVTFDDSVSPAAATWNDVSYPLTSIETLDPYLYTDPVTGRTFELQETGDNSLLAFTDDHGAHWTPAATPVSAPSFDHESMGGGPYAAGSSAPSNPYGRALYYCAQGDFVGQCARSDNGGQTWGAPVPFTTATSACAPSHGRVTVGPDGTVYVPVAHCGTSGQGVFVSRDNGSTWKQVLVPGTTAGHSDPAIAIDKGGKVYEAAASGGTLVVSTSSDSGSTFGRPVDVGAVAGVRNAEFAMATAGDAGRAAVAFYGTPTGGDDQADGFTGAWHIFVGITTNGGQTWTVTDVTGSDPVQRGLICMSGIECTNGRNLLDFQSIGVDRDGRVLVGFADGCTSAGCIAANGKNNVDADSSDSLGTIARQTSGPLLKAST
jgi:hypothetical protein